MMMEICDSDPKKEFLHLGVNSFDEDISDFARDSLNKDPKDEEWYKFYMAEYEIFVERIKKNN